ncbi:hypothetical protein BDA99DRAFT_428537 [Phascolomyces articulosus]|uniref:EamA domain-containing protein n=1 Tax=Phascolomyces articulosus TaxID=60185 RepID=A0AAD5KBV3_9FUNG|nr:hypothetical protein BDA99DRAFT_428537 [Phascolomyces articulosus]
MTRRAVFGMFMIAMASLAVSSSATLVKLGSKFFPSTQILLVRYCLQASVSWYGCYQLGIHPLSQGNARKWVLIRGIVGSFSSFFWYYSIKTLPLADVTVITNMHPLFAAVFGAFMLNEPFGWFERACILLCMIGAVLVTKPSFLDFLQDQHNNIFMDNSMLVLLQQQTIINDDSTSSLRTLGLISAFLGAICSAFAYVSVRKAGPDAHFFNHMLSLALATIFFSLFDFQSFTLPNDGSFHPYAILTAIVFSAFLGQCLLNRGLQLAPAGPGTLMCVNEMFFAFLFGIFIFHGYPDYLSILGSVMIIAVSAGLGWEKWKSGQS